MYKAQFFYFLQSQQIDKSIKVNTFLETRRNGHFLLNIPMDFFCNISTVNIGLRIISTYYKKSLLPEQYENQIFFYFLHTNTNYFLDNDIIKSIQMFLSQFFVHAHIDLKRNKENLNEYSQFLNQIYKFCKNILITDLFEFGVQVLHILLDISKGKFFLHIDSVFVLVNTNIFMKILPALNCLK